MTRPPFRQGDVLIIAADTIPADGQPVPRDCGHIVLAYGEATGHTHAIDHQEAALVETDLGRRFLQVLADGGVTLRHQEHDPIVIPPGVYEVRRQREYEPEAPRWVAD